MTGPDLAPRAVRLNHQLRQNIKIMEEGGKSSVAESGLDPDSLRFLDPDSQLGSGSRRAKMTHKKIKKLINLIFLSAGCSLLI
jgi:hypothetical protein